MLLELGERLARLIRIKAWLDKLVIVIVCLLLLITMQQDSPYNYLLIPLAALYTISVAVFGYTLNAICDLQQDQLVGKTPDQLQNNLGLVNRLIALSASVAVATTLVTANIYTITLGLANLAMVFAYSSHHFRLKEKGLLGVVSGSLGQRTLPFVVFAASVQPMSGLAWYLAAWLTALGIQMMLVHQLLDFANDRLTAVSTFAQQLGKEKTQRLSMLTTGITILTACSAPLIFPFETGMLLMTVLLLVAGKSLLGTGNVILSSRHSLSFEQSEKRLASEPLGQQNTLKQHIDAGRRFLLMRLRNGEIASRAPDDCPHKKWDWKGEPYLSLNLVIALKAQLTGADTELLGHRLLSQQYAGAWDYANGHRGPDADTSASAIRALDRIGESVGLSGLQSFYNDESQLFNTFRVKGEYAGLQLPPQTRQGHFGAHPCVLPNIWLLLNERGQLAQLPVSNLSAMQGPNGLWLNYFYLSPYYSTRLFCELLSQQGNSYLPLLEKTLSRLLTIELPSSPTQLAEIAISLHYLGQVFPNQRDDIQSRALALVKQLQQLQKKDGSWEGEVIWQFVHRTHPQPVEGLDCFRVHATSLAVIALDLWDQQTK